MRFSGTNLSGLIKVAAETRNDDRGTFARAYCEEEFKAQGLETGFVQANVAYTKRAGILRGLHYQVQPWAETKLVCCIKGAIFDVAVDVRPGSPTFLHWAGVELSEGDGIAMYIPQGFAHGYQAVSDNAGVFYMSSAPYKSSAEAGIRYDDPSIRIHWPLPPREISDKDRSWPSISEDRK